METYTPTKTVIRTSIGLLRTVEIHDGNRLEWNEPTLNARVTCEYRGRAAVELHAGEAFGSVEYVWVIDYTQLDTLKMVRWL